MMLSRKSGVPAMTRPDTCARCPCCSKQSRNVEGYAMLIWWYCHAKSRDGKRIATRVHNGYGFDSAWQDSGPDVYLSRPAWCPLVAVILDKNGAEQE
jgi:hypothetical protein